MARRLYLHSPLTLLGKRLLRKLSLFLSKCDPWRKPIKANRKWTQKCRQNQPLRWDISAIHQSIRVLILTSQIMRDGSKLRARCTLPPAYNFLISSMSYEKTQSIHAHYLSNTTHRNEASSCAYRDFLCTQFYHSEIIRYFFALVSYFPLFTVHGRRSRPRLCYFAAYGS